MNASVSRCWSGKRLVQQRTTGAFKNNGLVNREILTSHIHRGLTFSNFYIGTNLSEATEILRCDLRLCFLPGESTQRRRYGRIWAEVWTPPVRVRVAFYARVSQDESGAQCRPFIRESASILPWLDQVRGTEQLIVQPLGDSRNSAYSYSSNKSISQPRTTPRVAVPRKSNVNAFSTV